jgi:hypothetical protein
VIGKIGEKYNYKIEYRNTSKTLTHSELNNYVFESPGDYQISPQEIITEKYFGKKINSEESIPMPLTFSVKVDSVRMNLNPLSIKINTPLKQNSSMTGAILSIEVEFTNYFNTPISFNNKQLKLEAAGIGAKVKGVLLLQVCIYLIINYQECSKRKDIYNLILNSLMGKFSLLVIMKLSNNIVSSCRE